MKLKVGIIGLGVGEAHIEGYQSHSNCEVVSLCDFNKLKLAKIRKKYPDMKTTLNADEVLEDKDINAVSIASFDNYHYEQIVKAIKNNKHIFVEKPLCLHEKHAKHISSLLKSKPRLKMSSNLILRKIKRFEMIKKLMEKRKFGQLFHVEGDYNYGRIHKITKGWRGKLDFYSVICGGGVHIIDLLMWIVNEKVVEVSAYGNKIATKNTRFKYNDCVVSILKFKSGLIGKVTANFGCVYPHFHRLSIYGTKATFINELDNGKIYDSRNPKILPHIINDVYPGVNKGDLIYSFVDSILNKTKCPVTKEDVLNAMSVCFAIDKAVKTSSSVKVKYL